MAALHIMGYLNLRYNSRLAFDLSYSDIDHSKFWDGGLADFYEGAVEVIPADAPTPERGRGGFTNEGRQQ